MILLDEQQWTIEVACHSQMVERVVDLTHHRQDMFALEVGRYIENIINISPISIYRYHIDTLDIVVFDISILYR